MTRSATGPRARTARVVAHAAAIATGPLPRIILGEWAMLRRLHVIPDSVEEFSGYSLDWDLIAGNFGSSEPYRAAGTAQVRNITLPPAVGHITAPLAKPRRRRRRGQAATARI